MSFNMNKDANGNPEILWISQEAIALTMCDCKQGQGLEYIRKDFHDRQINELKEQILFLEKQLEDKEHDL
jgi:hypothetical protein